MEGLIGLDQRVPQRRAWDGQIGAHSLHMPRGVEQTAGNQDENHRLPQCGGGYVPMLPGQRTQQPSAAIAVRRVVRGLFDGLAQLPCSLRGLRGGHLQHEQRLPRSLQGIKLLVLRDTGRDAVAFQDIGKVADLRQIGQPRNRDPRIRLGASHRRRITAGRGTTAWANRRQALMRRELVLALLTSRHGRPSGC